MGRKLGMVITRVVGRWGGLTKVCKFSKATKKYVNFINSDHKNTVLLIVSRFLANPPWGRKFGLKGQSLAYSRLFATLFYQLFFYF